MSTLNGSRKEMIAGSPPPPPPHVVMLPTPGLGHENPFLQAARRIADEGIIVTYVSTDRHISRALNRPGFVHLRSSSSFQLLRFVNFRELPGWNGSCSGKRLSPNHANPRSGNEANSPVGGSGDRPLFPRTEKTRLVASAPPPCCILHDMFSTWAQDVAMSPQPVASPSYSRDHSFEKRVVLL